MPSWPETTGTAIGPGARRDVQVASDPVGVDVELDRPHRAGADERGGEPGRETVLARGPHQLTVGGDAQTGARDGR